MPWICVTAETEAGIPRFSGTLYLTLAAAKGIAHAKVGVRGKLYICVLIIASRDWPTDFCFRSSSTPKTSLYSDSPYHSLLN